MIKTRWMALVAVLCLCAFPMAGSGAEKLAKADLVFTFEGSDYKLGDEAQPLVDAIEAVYGPMEKVEIDSCLFTGIDREFSNDEIVLGTYPIGKNGADQIETVMIVGGSLKTPRGIGIGSTKDEVVSAYGPDFVLEYDQMTYATGNPLTAPILVFVLDLQTNAVTAYYMMRNSS